MNTALSFQLQFSTLLRVSLSHEYYRDGFINGLRIVPDAATRIWLRNHQMIFKAQDNAFTIGAKAGQDLRPRPGDLLRFEAYTTDPHLDSVTSGRFRKAHEVYYHAALSPDNQSFDHIAIQYPHFILKFLEGDSNKPLTIKDKTNSTVWEGSPTGDQLPVRLPLDTTGYHALYQADGTQVAEFYILPKRTQGLFACLEIPVASLMRPDWATHHLRLSARAVQWRYVLVPYHATSDLEHLSITAQQRDAPYGWQDPQRTTLHTGQSAIVLTSQQPIPIHALPQWRFVLKALKTDTQEHIQIQLPTPQLRQLVAAPDAPDSLRAEMFVRF